MCNVAQDVMDKLTTTVKQFLDEGRMFTAYDVTIETRTREKMNLKHADTRGAVHEIDILRDAMDFGHDGSNGTIKWNKSQMPMPDNQWAFVFHPSNLDPKQYQPRAPAARNTAPASQLKQLPPALSISSNDGTASDSGGQQPDGTFATDYRERLMIPTRFMREAGINSGDNCYVIADSKSNMVLVCKEDPSLQGVNFTVQKVEKDGELRLSSKTLRLADLTDNKFVIETTDQTLGSQTVKVVAVKKNTVASATTN